MRIVSLLPSATEIIYALGLGDQLVGVSHECDFPPEAKTKPVITAAEINSSQPSRQIDASVKEQVHKGVGIYHINQDVLKQAKPDVVFTQELCEVCAVSFSEVKQAVRILNTDTKIVSLEPRTLGDILNNIKTVGDITSRQPEAAKLVVELQQRIDKVKAITKDVDFRPTTLCLDWMDPPYAAGHWIPEMAEIAGGVDSFGVKGQASVEINWERVVEVDPERIIVMPCGFDIQRAMKEIGLLKSVKGWNQISAVRNSRAYIADGNSYFSRPGPRVVTGLEILAEVIQSDYFIDVAPANSYQWI